MAVFLVCVCVCVCVCVSEASSWGLPTKSNPKPLDPLNSDITDCLISKVYHGPMGFHRLLPFFWMFIPVWEIYVIDKVVSNICEHFHPEPWGFMIQFDEHIFQMGWFNHHQRPRVGSMVGFFSASASSGHGIGSYFHGRPEILPYVRNSEWRLMEFGNRLVGANYPPFRKMSKSWVATKWGKNHAKTMLRFHKVSVGWF